MIIDSLLRACAAQAFTAVAVSAASIDIGAPGGVGTPTQRHIGTGEPIGWAFTVDVAASSTTVKLEAIMATDAALTAGIVVEAERTVLAADLALGRAIFLPLPPGAPAAGALRYRGVRVTPAGGAATVTLTAELMPLSMFSIGTASYAKGFNV